MNQRSPVGLLTIRAWCEDRSDNPLRVEIRLTNDVSAGFQEHLTVAQIEEAIDQVRAFLDDVLWFSGA